MWPRGKGQYQIKECAMRLHKAWYLWRIATVLGAVWALLSTALASDKYPSQAITIVIPFGAGGESDSAARALAPLIEKHFPGSTIKLQNMPGNSGILAAKYVLDAPADGYTVLLGRVANLGIAPALDSTLPYAAQDFAVLSILERTPFICVVPNDSEIANARDMIKALRDPSKKLTYATTGETSGHYLAGLYMLKLIGRPAQTATPMHLNSAVLVNEAVLSGKAQFAFNHVSSLLPLLRDRKLRALFTNAPGRIAALPDLPSASEVGLRELSQITGWSALAVSKKTPKAIIERWRVVLMKATSDPQWQAYTTNSGGPASMSAQQSPDEFVANQVELYEELAILSGLRK
jgi:tripartite-type tricarboxylate transporter receptor subunit TctC